MTTSSFERNRCTRISPSAVLDDRLDGKDLEWARDHLRRCEACRERVEDFREMLLRVGRLPSATVGAAAMDQAFALSIPERLRGQGSTRTFEIAPAQPAIPEDVPQAVRPEVSAIPDLLTELEREIFRDEPSVDHPMPLPPPPEPHYPLMGAPVDEIESAKTVEPVAPVPVEPVEAAAALETEPVVEAEPEPAPAFPEMVGPWREVPVDSHRELEFPEWNRGAEPVEAEPEPEAAPVAWSPPPAAPVHEEPAPPVTSNAVFAEEPPLAFDEAPQVTPPAPPRKLDTAMRIAVGLGAAACVLLAAVLYEGGWFSKGSHKVSSTAATATLAVHHPSPTVHASVSPSVAPSASAAPAAPVLYTLGNGASGGTMYRIRPGTAVAGYTRLVFDIHGGGLPTMIVTRPDDLHVAITFKGANVAGAPVNGIRSYQVAAVEPGVQQGPDGTITIDLARPVRVTAFTLPATGSYAWRLVVDLYTS
jgi:hypothetical protein